VSIYPDLFVPPEALIHRVTVERGTSPGVDASGVPVESWATVYADLPALCEPQPGQLRPRVTGTRGGGIESFGQEAVELRYTVYFGQLPTGELPDVRGEDRLVFGTWPGGAVRYINVLSPVDEEDAGVLLVLTGTARKPG
jgi:hypothetical protein